VIEGLEDVRKLRDVMIFHAGTARHDGKVVTDGGRVLCITAYGNDVVDARRKAYEAAGRMSFNGVHYRRDIGVRAHWPAAEEGRH
jgi:phosphoribosylamine--glycine ligase